MLRTAIVSTYAPRHCGIATFTTDLVRAVGRCEIVALQPPDQVEKNPPEVHRVIQRDVRADHVEAARWVNRCGAGVVSIQHDTGIWGGEDDSHVLDFVGAADPARRDHAAHPAARQPTAAQLGVMQGLLRQTHATVVMSRAAAAAVTGVYGADPARVHIIPRGVPDLPFVDADSVKPAVGVAGRRVLLELRAAGPQQGLRVDARGAAGGDQGGAHGPLRDPGRDPSRAAADRGRRLSHPARGDGQEAEADRSRAVRGQVRGSARAGPVAGGGGRARDDPRRHPTGSAPGPCRTPWPLAGRWCRRPRRTPPRCSPTVEGVIVPDGDPASLAAAIIEPARRPGATRGHGPGGVRPRPEHDLVAGRRGATPTGSPRPPRIPVPGGGHPRSRCGVPELAALAPPSRLHLDELGDDVGLRGRAPGTPPEHGHSYATDDICQGIRVDLLQAPVLGWATVEPSVRRGLAVPDRFVRRRGRTIPEPPVRRRRLARCSWHRGHQRPRPARPGHAHRRLSRRRRCARVPWRSSSGRCRPPASCPGCVPGRRCCWPATPPNGAARWARHRASTRRSATACASRSRSAT